MGLAMEDSKGIFTVCSSNQETQEDGQSFELVVGWEAWIGDPIDAGVVGAAARRLVAKTTETDCFG
jgi:hypothetical protein